MIKKFSAKITCLVMAILMIFSVITCTAVSAAELLDSSTKVSITLNCSKPGYEFVVYKVASLTTTTSSPYKTEYTSLVPAASASIASGNTADILKALDDVNTMPSAATVVGTFTTSATSTEKTIGNLEQGMYYVRATNYPAGVKSVTNSVVALPYYDGSDWVYSISDINLASKVTDDVPVTKKEITNSTKGNVNYTDVSLGDTINFSIKSTTAGSLSMRLGSYIIYDDMSAGLTLNKNSFKVSLLKQDGTKIKDLATSDYKVTVTKEKAGENTTFNVALTKEYLQGTEFYGADVYYTDVTYTADLNKYAIVGKMGNPNKEVELEYSNKNGVTAKVDGNDVYVYTYAVKTNKLNPEGTSLSGAKFSLFKSEADAKSLTNEIATGVSDSNGLVKYYNAKNEEIKLASGKYFIVETEAPDGYNLYGKVIPIEINAEYGDTFVNNTYVINCPEDGYGSVDVTDTRLVLPQTGGIGTQFMYVISGVFGMVGFVMIFCLVILVARERIKR